MNDNVTTNDLEVSASKSADYKTVEKPSGDAADADRVLEPALVSETVREAVPEGAEKAVPEVVPAAAERAVPEAVPEGAEKVVPETAAEAVPAAAAEAALESEENAGMKQAAAQDQAEGIDPVKKVKKSKGKRKSRSARKAGKPRRVRRKWYARLFLCCISFAAVLGIINLAYYKLGMEPFGTNTVAIDDAKIQYIDFFTYYVDVLHGTRSLTYDFSNMLGGSSVGMFSYYLASPFNLLLYFFGKEGVYRFFNVAVALKLSTAGATFSWYLQRRFADRIRPVFVIALSMGYALMQYQVAQSSNIMWLDGVYMLPLILLGVYEVLHRKTVWRLALAVAFCIFCNWYIAGLNCLFSGIWFMFEFFFRDEFLTDRRLRTPAVPDRRYSGSRRRLSRLQLGVTEFVVSFCRYVWGMGLGVVMSSVMFLPAISAMRQGKGQYDKVEVLMNFSGDLLSSLRGYVIGTTSSRGFAALFCGGIVVFSALGLLFSGFCRIRQKIAYLCLLGVCFLMLHWEPAMMVFSLMKRADSYWYRYSYLVCFALLFGAGAYLSRAEKDRWSKVFVILLSFLYAAGILKLNGIGSADFAEHGIAVAGQHKVLFATAGASIVLAVLTVLLLSLKPGRRKDDDGMSYGVRRLARLAAGILLLVITGAELWANALIYWQNNFDNSQALYMAYFEGMQKQLSQLRAVDGGYYRIAQDRTRWHYEDDLTAFLNDSLAQNYWSNTAYTSSPDNTQLSLMWRLGYRDEAGCMMIVRDPVLPSDSFMGVKYYLQSTPIKGLEPVEGVEAFNGRSVYRNPYALPMAFVYDGAKLPTMRYDRTFAYQNALFSTLCGKETELYTPLSWTREKKENLTYFDVYVPKGNYLVYGNLLWPEKMTGLMSINGAEPFGYCRWMSPAVFMIRSRTEQEQSTAKQSLQAAAREAAKAGEQPAGEEGVSKNSSVRSNDQDESLVQIQKKELQERAAAYDQETLASLNPDIYEDLRTLVFRSEKDISFSDYQFYGLNLDVLGEAVEMIRKEEVPEDNLSIENGHVTCTLEGKPGQSVCFLVPLSKGWQALRNGEPVQPDTIAGTMITIPLINGTNKIELTYQIPYLREGMYISLAAVGTLLVDILLRLLSCRKKR